MANLVIHRAEGLLCLLLLAGCATSRQPETPAAVPERSGLSMSVQAPSEESGSRDMLPGEFIGGHEEFAVLIRSDRLAHVYVVSSGRRVLGEGVVQPDQPLRLPERTWWRLNGADGLTLVASLDPLPPDLVFAQAERQGIRPESKGAQKQDKGKSESCKAPRCKGAGERGGEGLLHASWGRGRATVIFFPLSQPVRRGP